MREDTAPARVLIVDDHVVLAQGLAALLSEEPDFEVVGVAHDAQSAVRLAAEQAPQIVVMDYHLPDATGAEAATQIRRSDPDLTVVFLTAEESDAALTAAVQAGAVGYLLKSASAAQITSSLRRALEGEMLIPASVLAQLVTRQRREEVDSRRRDRLLGELTPRELEVLEMMSRGVDNYGIAEALHISYTTVRGHVRSLLAKLDAHTKLEALARAVEYGILYR